MDNIENTFFEEYFHFKHVYSLEIKENTYTAKHHLRIIINSKAESIFPQHCAYF